ncbi:ABC transporter substrate-binding protein [Ponticaulis sp.]|uniref:ABC transporter substrate-binding protein n=1 Tax=Ponticaulis sp. TaxID=2020902 RepID=UPI000C5AD3E1|nr:ABC transporter substrate-binding protein [Ponticaulis sp.]MBN06154.1 hypothetical protein [Ponticaulis sp.]
MVPTLRTTAAAAATLLLCTGAAQAEIKIGVLYPIAGTGAVYGTPAMHGHNMGADEVNAAGGILGQQIVTVARDTKLKPAAGRSRRKGIDYQGRRASFGGWLELGRWTCDF